MSVRTVLGTVAQGLRRVGWFVVLSVLVGAVVWSRLLAPVKVHAVRLSRGPVVQEAFGRGTVEAQQSAAVGFDLVGRLSAVLVAEGARVTRGQELARLETNQALADLRTAQTGIGAARASLNRLAAEEERARALLSTAERDAARTQTLFATGALSAQQRDDSMDRVRLARAELDRVLAQRSEATRGIDVAAGSVEQRRVAMVRATLLAPFDGLITRRLRDPGDTVTVGSTVLRIVDTTRVYVSAMMDETVLRQLAVDQRCAILFPADTLAIAGRVTRVSWEADRQTHELVVDVTPEMIDRAVAIGQRADVRVEIARHDSVLRIPVAMIQHDTDGPLVYVDRAGKIALVRPRFGLSGGDYVEVLSALAVGDTVLSAHTGVAPLPVSRRWVAQ